MRNVCNGLYICCNIFPRGTIASGRGIDKLTPLIAQAQREPVNFRLSRQLNSLCFIKCQKPFDPAYEIIHIFS